MRIPSDLICLMATLVLLGVASSNSEAAPSEDSEVRMRGAALNEAAPDEAAEAALRNLRRVSTSGTPSEREKALDAIIALNDPQLLGPLGEELGRVAIELRKARAAAAQLRYDILRKEELIADLERRLAMDSSLESSLDRQRNRLTELKGKFGSKDGTAQSLEPWYEILRRRTSSFAATAPSGARKKVEKDLWKTAEDDSDFELRGAAIEVLGCVGDAGTAVRLQKSVADFAKERTSLRGKLPKLMKDVLAMEERMQEEAVRMDGRVSLGEQYERTKAEAAAVQQRVSQLGILCDTAVVAGGHALAREEPEERAKTIDTLMRAQKKSKNGEQSYSLMMIGASRLSEADDALFGLLKDSKEPLVRVTLIGALSASSHAWASQESKERYQALLLNDLLLDASWFVRGAAAGALAKLRSKEAIPVLISRLEKEKGRMLDDLGRALISLTGKDFHGNLVLWQRWWGENAETFVVPPIDEMRQALDEQEKERRGSTFFGISTESTRVLYVIDLSGSMNWSMIPRGNPDDEQGKAPDLPAKGELSRLAEAKLALNKAIAGTARGGVFNIIFYASDVWSWSDSLAELNDENCAEALDMVTRLEAVGGTNIYGALKVALEMAGAVAGDRWTEPAIDTIYFLSDGRPSVGLTTDPAEILRFVRELNASAGIVIHTIGLSGAQDAYLLRSLAEENGGTYVSR